LVVSCTVVLVIISRGALQMGNHQYKPFVGEIFSDNWMKELQTRSNEIKNPLPSDKEKETDSRRCIRIIGDEGAEAFAFYFANNGKIEEVIIDGPCLPKDEDTFIGKQGFKCLAECFMRDNSLKKLTFSGQKIDFETASLLVDYLKENKNLTHITFWKCTIDDKTGVHIVKTLLHQPNLQNINLGENKVTEDGRSEIERLLIRNSNLKVDIF